MTPAGHPPPPVTMRDVARRVVDEQLDELRRMRKRARGGETEPVHRMRVATRRLRAALRVFQDVVPTAQGARRRLRRLARRLGAVRDRDVMAALLRRQLKQGLAPAERQRLLALLRAVRRERAQALQRLARRLGERRQRALRRSVAQLAHRGAAPGDDEELATIGLARAVARLADEVSRQSAMREARPSPDALHQLRIAMKRLRYVLEFHASAGGLAYDAELEVARAVQDCLGELRDIDVVKAAMKDGRGAFAGPWPVTSRRLGVARRERLARFVELRERWRELTRAVAEGPGATAFPSLEAAPVTLRLISGGRQIASAMIR